MKSATVKSAAVWTKILWIAVLAVLIYSAQVRAADLPLAAASPLTGVAFDDRPLLLPVQRNFQMAMLTAGSELGRSCGKMEAYGWRMGQTEQGRVNQIFNNTVDRMRLTGYTITPQKISSISNDITLFTADRADKHFMFLWSAGELGLVMTLCQTTAPVPMGARPDALTPSVQVFQIPTEVVSAHLDAVSTTKPNGTFSPIGQWEGGYTCVQGYTGGTLQINAMKGQSFDGVFKFYPTEKNMTVPAGAYNVYGEYDSETKRILINPASWISRPKNFYNTVIVGSFDANHDTFSAYFQGVSGCTSFEAHRVSSAAAAPAVIKHKKIVKKKPLVKAVQPAPTNSVTPAPTTSGNVAPADAAATTPAPVGSSAPLGTSAVGTSAPVTVPAEKQDPVGITLMAPAKN